MRKVILSLVVISCVGAAAVGAQTGITPLPKEKLEGPVLSLPETIVKELYRVHRNGSGQVFERRGRKLQQKFFDRKLAALIWKNLSETPEGEVGNLDFDPRVRLVFHLVNTKEGWKVSNIDYGEGSDLVQILSQPM